MTATDTNPPITRRRTRGVPADTNSGDVNTETGAATADAEAVAEEAKSAAQTKAIDSLAKAIGKDMNALYKTVKKGDKDVREKWLSLGRHLIEIRGFFETVDEDGNTGINKIGFGNAIKDHKIDELCPNKNNRTDAIWLADTVDASPNIVDLMELDAEDGGKSLGHPKTIKRWFDRNMADACQVALDLGVASSKDAADDLGEAVGEIGDGEVTEEQIAATEFVNVVPEGDFESALKKYKPKVVKLKFADNTVEACAATIMVLLISHEKPEAINEKVHELLAEWRVKMEKDAAAAEAEASGVVEDADDADIDEDDEEFPT